MPSSDLNSPPPLRWRFRLGWEVFLGCRFTVQTAKGGEPGHDGCCLGGADRLRRGALDHHGIASPDDINKGAVWIKGERLRRESREDWHSTVNGSVAHGHARFIVDFGIPDASSARVCREPNVESGGSGATF